MRKGKSYGLASPLGDFRSGGLPLPGGGPGAYTYYFGIDLKGNGRFEPQFFVFDTLVVFVR